MVADKRVNAITFTGSNATGEKIHREIGIGRRVQLELGGKNPVLVLDDADIDLAVNVVIRSSFSLAGQACTGAGRIIVSKKIFDVLLERVLSEVKKIVLGAGNAPKSTMGPMVDGIAITAMESAIAEGVKDGVVSPRCLDFVCANIFDFDCVFPSKKSFIYSSNEVAAFDL